MSLTHLVPLLWVGSLARVSNHRRPVDRRVAVEERRRRDSYMNQAWPDRRGLVSDRRSA